MIILRTKNKVKGAFKMNKTVRKVVNKVVNFFINVGTKFVSGVSQKEAEAALGDVTITEGMPELLRSAAAEGAVLIKNTGVLPYKQDEKVSVFSRLQTDWFFTGYGSGGDVKKPYGVSPLEGLRNSGVVKVNEELAKVYADWIEENPVDHGFWGHWPRFYPDMPLTDEIVKAAAEKSDSAIYAIGRSSGEDRENALSKGSFYLTDDERNSLNLLTKHFKSVTVLLNIGSMIDMSWLEEYGDKIGAVLLVWMGGMESGNAVADLLCGKQNPSGKLSDTIARHYEDYSTAANFGKKEYNEYQEDIYVGYRYFETFKKDAVLYPFGFGLSYTKFDVKFDSANKTEDGIDFVCTVKNIGDVAGKEVAQVYISKPNGKLGNPARELVGFEKTKLLAPNESETLTISVPKSFFNSYDDCGKTGFEFSYVMEQGEYAFYLGTDVRSAQKVYSFNQDETVCIEKLKQAAAPLEGFERMVNDNGTIKKELCKGREYDLKKVILDKLPKDIAQTGDKGYKLIDVKTGKVSMDDFVAQLSLEELEAISRGDYVMDSSLGAKGNAGALGGVLPSLREKGVPAVTTTDGPSGIRLLSYCSLIPIGSLFACSFDKEMVEAVYTAMGDEMAEKGSDILLAPGMNIHRNPLCGRNFEYFSEDPVLSGRMAAATVNGIQKHGKSACPKHFACNNQEYNRLHNDARVSERALREIYLKGFEICVKESKPNTLMTSYNRINSVWGHYNYDLCERILRNEWGYEGMVMTDWWMRYKKSPEFPQICDNGYRVRATVDVLMPGGKRVGPHKPDGTLLKTYGKEEGITLGEMQYVAKHVLNLCMHYIDEK